MIDGLEDADTICGGEGNDVISPGEPGEGPSEPDVVSGDAGNDRFREGQSFDSIVSFEQAPGPIVVDLVRGGATGWGDDRIKSSFAVEGSRYSDSITGDDSINFLSGRARRRSHPRWGWPRLPCRRPRRRLARRRQGSPTFTARRDAGLCGLLRGATRHRRRPRLWTSQRLGKRPVGRNRGHRGVTVRRPNCRRAENGRLLRCRGRRRPPWPRRDRLPPRWRWRRLAHRSRWPRHAAWRRRWQTGIGLARPGNDRLRGGPGNDDLAGWGGRDVLEGRPGADRLGEADSGNDTIDGGPGADWAVFEFAPRRVVASLVSGRAVGDGQDRLVSIERLIGSRFSDRLVGSPGSDTIYGRGGADLIFGARGNDFLFGEDGSDRLDGGADRDWLDGGPGRDRCTTGERRRSCP